MCNDPGSKITPGSCLESGSEHDMVKIKTISRSLIANTRESTNEILKVQRNPDPELHPFEKAREYTRALNSTKLDRAFAKPFIGALSGHRDGVYCMSRVPELVSSVVSGACDGEIRIWSMTTKKCRRVISNAHQGFVRGVTCPSSSRIISCGDDRTVKIWDLPSDAPQSEKGEIDDSTPLATRPCDEILSDVSSGRRNLFATSGGTVAIWDQSKAEPLAKYRWGTDTFTAVRFNPIEQDLIAAAATDRSVCLYDVRANSPVRKLILRMRTNSVAWNPMEAFNLTIANEDMNCYTYDIRKLDHAINVHKDHVGAVLSVDYSPTGKEFATGSYDQTVRIFRVDQGRSREVYHTKRMQRIFCVNFSSDATYVLSGSDDMNIRIWKAEASKPLGTIHPRQKSKLEYEEQLKKRYASAPEIRRIARHRHLPRRIVVAKQQGHAHLSSAIRKEKNRRKHSKPGSRPVVKEREKHTVEEME